MGPRALAATNIGIEEFSGIVEQHSNRRMQFWRQTPINAVDLDAASDWLASAEISPKEQVLVRQQVVQVWKVVENLSPR